MDCSTCRGLFSASFDGRMAGERRQEYRLHVEACEPCASEFALYQRVFSVVRELPDGAAPPFQVPNEVPGSLAQASRFAAPPRFARAAAGILLLIGLVGTHVLVFQWSRDQFAGAATSGVTRVDLVAPRNLPIAEANMGTVLPPSLRDHVETTDLFLRTAAQAAELPESARARDLAAADWAISDLERRTAGLREQRFTGPETARLIQAYASASEDFAVRMRRILDDPTHRGAVRAICDAANESGIVRRIEGIKPVVAPLQLGTSCEAALTPSAALAGLTPDARLILEAKHASLAGRLPKSIHYFEQFHRDFTKSSLKPLASYLHADALWRSGQYCEAQRVWALAFAGRSCGSQEAWTQFIRTLDVGSIRVHIDLGNFQHPMIYVRPFERGLPMKAKMPLQPLVEDSFAPAASPKN